jgi:hypothetical protein
MTANRAFVGLSHTPLMGLNPVPDAVQKSFETSIALFSASPHAAAAQAMVDFFASPANTPLFREKGLEHAIQ